ncbi:MAG: tetratricopeptide repeat protein, partial [Gemmatimonadota bacterium]
MATSARLDELKKKFDENPRRYFAPLANEYRKLGDLPQAIALCRAHLPNQPGHVSGHIVLAQSLHEAHELGESQQAFEMALELDPENLIALRYLGDISREQGDLAQARTWYERVLDADPRNDEIAQLLKAVEAGAPATGFPDDTTVQATPQGGTPTVAADAVAPPAQWVPASPIATIHEDFPEPVEILGDFPEPLTLANTAAMEPTTTDESIGGGGATPMPDDLFAGEPAAQLLGELEAVAEPTPDDWFALPTAPSSGIGASEGEVSAASGAEDSFFPDLSQVTPTASPTVTADPGAGEREDLVASDAPTPPYLAAFPESLATAPTPPFLAAVERDPSSTDGPMISAGALEPADTDLAEAPHGAADDGFTLDAEAGAEPGIEEAVAGGDVPEVWSAETVESPAPDTVEPVEGKESSEELLGYAEASQHEGAPEGFMIEYGEFVPPAEDDTPFIANTIAVPLEESDPYSVGAPELSAHEPFPIESAFDEPGVPATPGLAAEGEVEAEAQVEPIEGLVSREVHAGAEAELEAGVAEPDAEVASAPFVTETMAELYLQQGFHDEALAIYRQLLAQAPDDLALRDRVQALDRGASSAVVAGVAPRDAADRHGQSVRSFFAHFARREPRRRADRSVSDGDAEASHSGVGGATTEGDAYAGAATREEALTVPDEPQAAPSLTQLFASGAVSNADENAANTLASAFETRGGG